jgi:hypothetical protein
MRGEISGPGRMRVKPIFQRQAANRFGIRPLGLTMRQQAVWHAGCPIFRNPCMRHKASLTMRGMEQPTEDPPMRTGTALVATLFALTSIPLLGQQSPPDSQSASPAMQQSSPPGAQPEQPAPDNQPSSPAAQPNQPGSQAAQPEQPSSQAASPETSAPAVDMRPVRGFEVVGQGYPPVYTDDSLITIGLRFRIYRIIYTL